MPDIGEISSTTQKFLDIFDITSDVVVLKDGTVSMILVVSAMNFGLLAEQEQDAIIYAYAALLNSLNFPIQIIISSKTKDATAYLKLLEDQAVKASTEEKSSLIKRYKLFVGQLIKERNVLDKKFFVSIPASPGEVGMITPQSVLPGNTELSLTKEQKAAVIEKGLGVLEPRRDHLIAQFNRIGLYARQILTQEIIEVFYNSYNPEAHEGQQITDSSDYTTMTVRAQTSPDLTPMKTLTEDNNSNQEKIESVQDVPEAGTAEVIESAVVPSEIPEAPSQNKPEIKVEEIIPQKQVISEVNNIQPPSPPQNIPLSPKEDVVVNQVNVQEVKKQPEVKLPEVAEL